MKRIENNVFSKLFFFLQKSISSPFQSFFYHIKSFPQLFYFYRDKKFKLFSRIPVMAE